MSELRNPGGLLLAFGSCSLCLAMTSSQEYFHFHPSGRVEFQLQSPSQVSLCFGFDSLVMFLCCSQCLPLNRSISGQRVSKVEVQHFKGCRKAVAVGVAVE